MLEGGFMLKYKLFIFTSILLFSYIFSSFAASATAVLQNGLDGYSGCEDAYMFLGSANTNYGNEADIYIAECPT